MKSSALCEESSVSKAVHISRALHFPPSVQPYLGNHRDKRMVFATYALLCLACGTRVILGAAANTFKPQVDIETAESDQGKTVHEETIQGKSVVST
jgi:hypothetical protein